MTLYASIHVGQAKIRRLSLATCRNTVRPAYLAGGKLNMVTGEY